MLCERGIRTFETATRFTLDVAAVPIAKARLGLPVVVDPSHAAGKRDWVECLTLSRRRERRRRAADRDAPGPAKALSDGPQAVVLSEFPALMDKVRAVAQALGRTLPVAVRTPVAAA